MLAEFPPHDIILWDIIDNLGPLSATKINWNYDMDY